jgi:formate hydrogenlyase transcriptional activator
MSVPDPGGTAASFRALLGVAESVAAHPDPPELLRHIAARLRAVVPFDFLGVLLHDPAADVLRLTVFVSGDDPAAPPRALTVTPDEAPSGAVWTGQEPLLAPDFAAIADRYPAMRPVWDELGMRSAYYVPLSTARQRLGVIYFGSRQLHAYPPEGLELFRFAARQAAVALEVSKLQTELRAERDRLRTLLEVTNAVAAHLDLRGLFRAISASLRPLVPAEYLSLALYVPAAHAWDLHALDFPTGAGRLTESLRTPFAAAPASLAFTARKPVALDRDGLSRFGADSVVAQALLAEGIHHWCAAPLLGRERVLGTINVGRTADKSFDPSEVGWLERVAGQIGLAVENALAFRRIEELSNRLAEEKRYLEDEIRTEHGFAEIVGISTGLKEVLRQVEIVAPADTTALILGETGTGKELIARAIHRLSKRAGRTFVKLNCAAIPTGLMESELFGHEKGAFTGAVARKVGRFELADGGTLFLDEVGDIPPDLQAKLLRVLQEQEFERLGGTKTLKVDVRLIAATNRDLAAITSEGRFRADLFYRLNVFPIRLPPLRERTGDIPLLVRYFVAQYARKLNRPITRIPEPVLSAMTRYRWPGNVRELENFIERCVLLSAGSELWAPVAELAVAESTTADESARTLVEAEREAIVSALAAAKGKVGGPAGAAARLGMKRTTLQSKMKKLGIAQTNGQSG